MLTDAEDHDIAPDNDGLTMVRGKVSTMSCACQSRKESRSAPPRHRHIHRRRSPGRAPRLVRQGERDEVGKAGATVDRYVQAEREELRDTAKDHDNGNHQVDDAAATKGDMLAL